MINPVDIFKALADETRFKVLTLLLTHDLCVGALASRVGVSKAAISQHLQILRKAGLVTGEKRGYWTHYTVERSLLQEIAGILAETANRTISDEALCPRVSSRNTDISERREMDMCKDCCEHPEKLKGTPEECSEEQINECHGDTKDHPCKEDKNK
jgi:DNA-binding transcriptional ArsR family regulator